MRILIIGFSILLSLANTSHGQTGTSVPSKIEREKIYLFYLHGGVVQAQGRNAVSSYYGKYEYDAIIDTLAGKGFYVISEVRPKGTKEAEYAQKISQQIDTLLNRGVSSGNIVIVGASLGAYMTLDAAKIIDNPDLRYVLIGLCSDYAVKYYSGAGNNIKGRFLSIYEKSDSKQSCQSIFDNRPEETEFKEVVLNMGIDHAFLYKPYKEWVDPLYEWIQETNQK